MNEMIEAAARAIYETDMPSGFIWDEEDKLTHARYAAIATAALRAMMELEPTDAMREEVYAWIRTAMDVDELWRALLGAIVDQGGE